MKLGNESGYASLFALAIVMSLSVLQLGMLGRIQTVEPNVNFLAKVTSSRQLAPGQLAERMDWAGIRFGGLLISNLIKMKRFVFCTLMVSNMLQVFICLTRIISFPCIVGQDAS